MCADSDAVKTVLVMEGDSVSLESGLTELQTRDVLMWTFGLSVRWPRSAKQITILKTK